MMLAVLRVSSHIQSSSIFIRYRYVSRDGECKLNFGNFIVLEPTGGTFVIFLHGRKRGRALLGNLQNEILRRNVYSEV